MVTAHYRHWSLHSSCSPLSHTSFEYVCARVCVCLRFGRCEHVFESIKVAEICEFIHAGERLIVRTHMYTFVCIYKSRCVPACAFVCVRACVYSAAQALPIQPPSPRLELKQRCLP